MNIRKHTVVIACSIMLAAGVLLYNIQLPYYTKVPVSLDESLMPCIDVSIEDKSYSVGIDLGSRLEMDIYSDTLSSLKKSPYSTESWKTFTGQKFSAPTFTIPKCYIGSLCFKKPIVVSASRKDEAAYTIWESQSGSSSTIFGYLGAGMLKKVNMLLDISHSHITFTNSTKQLKQNGYDLSSFVKVPFQFSLKGGIIIEVSTVCDTVKLGVDTGCTLTMLRKSLMPKNMKAQTSRHGFPTLSSGTFSIGGTNFGSKQLYFIDITEELDEIDGFLGMDFIKDHVIYIDFDHHMLYIKPS